MCNVIENLFPFHLSLIPTLEFRYFAVSFSCTCIIFVSNWSLSNWVLWSAYRGTWFPPWCISWAGHYLVWYAGFQSLTPNLPQGNAMSFLVTFWLASGICYIPMPLSTEWLLHYLFISFYIWSCVNVPSSHSKADTLRHIDNEGKNTEKSFGYTINKQILWYLNKTSCCSVHSTGGSLIPYRLIIA